MSSPPKKKYPSTREKERISTRRTFTLPAEVDQALQGLQAEEEPAWVDPWP